MLPQRSRSALAAADAAPRGDEQRPAGRKHGAGGDAARGCRVGRSKAGGGGGPTPVTGMPSSLPATRRRSDPVFRAADCLRSVGYVMATSLASKAHPTSWTAELSIALGHGHRVSWQQHRVVCHNFACRGQVCDIVLPLPFRSAACPHRQSACGLRLCPHHMRLDCQRRRMLKQRLQLVSIRPASPVGAVVASQRMLI